MEKVKPITPEEAFGIFKKDIDPIIIQAVNKIISEKFSEMTNTVKVLQKDIISEYKKLGGTLTSSQLYEKKQLDIEEIYRDAGWSVSYDKPAYNESYEPSFEFKKRKR